MEEAFPEDSKSFADYYFSEKLPGSKVLAIEGGKLLTMAHLNPYTISVNGKKMGTALYRWCSHSCPPAP